MRSGSNIPIGELYLCRGHFPSRWEAKVPPVGTVGALQSSADTDVPKLIESYRHEYDWIELSILSGSCTASRSVVSGTSEKAARLLQVLHSIN